MNITYRQLVCFVLFLTCWQFDGAGGHFALLSGTFGDSGLLYGRRVGRLLGGQRQALRGLRPHVYQCQCGAHDDGYGQCHGTCDFVGIRAAEIFSKQNKINGGNCRFFKYYV